MLPESFQKIHFVGIGGEGMSPIAYVLCKHGYEVSGSDLELNAHTKRLVKAGARIHQGHAAENLNPETDIVVVSTAIKESNVEWRSAAARGIPVWRRAEALAEIMKSGRSVAVAGAHGKTTTTSMVGLLLERANLDPTVLIGGELNDFGGNARIGESDLVVAEADESDGTFLLYSPHIAVITNVEEDHLDHWGTFEALEKGYVEFLNRLGPEDKAVVCVDCPGVRQTLADWGKVAITYGLSNPEAQWRARGIQAGAEGVSYDCYRDGKNLGRVSLPIPGDHNALNSLASIAAAAELGVAFETSRDALAGYRGAGRRWDLVGAADGVTVVDDYAHHPTEIAATLKAARSFVGEEGSVVCLFQPHRYSRTQLLGDTFGPAFSGADMLVVTDVYAAGETPIEGITGEIVFNSALRESGCETHYVPCLEDVGDFILDHLHPGDLALTMGAGNICDVGRPLLEALSARADAQDQ